MASINASGRILRVTSDEREDAPDSGDTANDVVIVDAHTVHVRAERSGVADGRVHRVEFEVTDADGNATASSCRIAVPIARGRPSTEGPAAFQRLP